MQNRPQLYMCVITEAEDSGLNCPRLYVQADGDETNKI